jgi:bifunctional N-acetylglucosamine-1-phosphate-uridyltransferase/glucosamine-1-phosphate-acetyltransferase GlmU-like protein
LVLYWWLWNNHCKYKQEAHLAEGLESGHLSYIGDCMKQSL